MQERSTEAARRSITHQRDLAQAEGRLGAPNFDLGHYTMQPTVRSRRHPRVLPEHPGEMRLAGKAEAERDLVNGAPVIEQGRASSIDPPGTQVLTHRRTVRSPEGRGEMNR